MEEDFTIPDSQDLTSNNKGLVFRFIAGKEGGGLQ